MAMEVILKQDVDHLGLRGEVVNVARGYARNFLLPRGLAQVATPALVRELEKRDTQRARHEAKSVDEARAIADRIEKLELRFDANAGPTGALFGSVTATNVADRLWDEEKIRVDRRKLEMETIKRIGRYRVKVDLFTDVDVELKLVVAPEGEELPPEEELAELEARERAETEAAEAAAAAEHQAAEAAEQAAIAAAEEVEAAESEAAESEAAEAVDTEPAAAEPEAAEAMDTELADAEPEAAEPDEAPAAPALDAEPEPEAVPAAETSEPAEDAT
jgi:large subunit ribosomal protein L9